MKVMMVYLEPTPYVLGLLDAIRHITDTEFDAFFVGENISQSWNLAVHRSGEILLNNGYVKAMMRINKMMKANRYSVIHLAGWGNRVLLSIIFLAWLKRLPIVVESDTQLPFGQAVWRRFLKALIYPFLFRIPKMFLPGGTRQSQYLRHYGVSAERIRIAKMTVDVTGIMKICRNLGEEGRKKIRTRYGFNDKNVVFVFVGRLLEHKGILHLIAAYEAVSLNNPDARLLIVGDGPEQDLVQKTAQAISSIQFVGRLDFPAVIEAYHAGDVCVVPSLFEPWGLVVNEAMAAGLPVIATERVGCIDDLLDNKKTGFIVPANDISALKDAMLTMVADGIARRKMGMNAKNLISLCTLESEAELIRNTWEKIASK